MEHLSKLYKDVPYDTLQNTIWWIEYVMRYNGAPALQIKMCNQPWYQRFDRDVIGFISIATFIIFLFSLWILLQTLRFFYKYYQIFYDSTQNYDPKLKKQ